MINRKQDSKLDKDFDEEIDGDVNPMDEQEGREWDAEYTGDEDKESTNLTDDDDDELPGVNDDLEQKR